jgi:magnesium chelatase family protein
MAVSTIYSAAIVGLDAQPVEVEVDIGMGLPMFLIVGLPDKAVEEAKERVRSAIKNSKAHLPDHRITVNLAPADLPKIGPSYDLPIAIGILAAAEQVKGDFEKSIFIGELALNGKIRRVNGVLPIILMAKEKGYKQIFLPKQNANEAALVQGVKIYPVETLIDLIFHLNNEKLISEYKRPKNQVDFTEEIDFDMADVLGQEFAKRALEIAAAGAHNVFMIGPPGAGKTLLARTIPSIMPKMSEDEILEVTKIHSVAGIVNKDTAVQTARPFRSPHHTASNIALVGGGQYPRPGEVTMAHQGVLFLDEIAEFSKSVLEALRQPLEDRVITISRAAGTLQFPAYFTLVAAMNPCPCGYLNHPTKNCICSPSQIIRYQKKISGPLLDRMDLYLDIPPVKYDKLLGKKSGEPSIKIRERVEKARLIQNNRFAKAGLHIKTNSQMGNKEIKIFCLLDSESENLMKSALERLNLSARSFYRILKIARTIADLENNEKIQTNHLAEALQYRPKDMSAY